MSVWGVADSGIFIATILPESYSQQAKALIQQWDEQKVRLAAPVLFRYECVAVIRKHVHRNSITVSEGIKKRDILLSQPVETMIDDNLLRRAYELAARFNRPTAYDSQYLAVAERLGCEFWTADERLYNAVSSDLNWVKWIAHFTK